MLELAAWVRTVQHPYYLFFPVCLTGTRNPDLPALPVIICTPWHALQVYGIDVGYGQVADKVRRDPRVTVMERFNLRHLKPEDLPTQVRQQQP